MKRADAVVLNKEDYKAITDTLSYIQTENYKLSESLQNIDMMVDAQGWVPVYDYGHDGGLTLAQLKDVSKQLREMVYANPFVKRGSQVRNTYVWGAGIEFGAQSTTGKPRKLSPAVRALVDKPANQKYIFSPDAQEELERQAYTDGNLFLLGDLTTKTLMRLGLSQITGDLRNPDNPEEIWAYRRQWFPNPNELSPKSRVAWYYTDVFEGVKRATLQGPDGKFEKVDRTKVIIDKSFNRQVGWAYGAPDALPIIAWARLYREFLINGFIMSRALAQFAFKAISKSKSGADNNALSIAMPGGAGRTASMTEGNDISPLATAGKGYDFASGRPLAAAMAAGVEVSVVSLTADPGNGTNATAQTLDVPARATAMMRRKSWEELFVRIFRFLGNDLDLRVTWHDLPEEQLQRRMQAWTLLHNTGLFKGEVIQRGMSSEMSLAEPGDIPADYMLPNNAKSLARKDVDGDGQGGNEKPTGSATAGTGQGRSTGRGGDSDDDHDDD